MGLPVPEPKDDEFGVYGKHLAKGTQMERKWYPGYQGKTSKGEFVVIRKTERGYLVHYISGPWEDKWIDMPERIGGESKTIEGLRLGKEQKEKLLDSFYTEYPERYNTAYNIIYRYTGKEPTTESVCSYLRDEFPAEFQLILSKFLES